MRMRPGCSVTKSRFGSSGGDVTYVGRASPDATSTERIAVPEAVGTPSHTTVVLSSWQVAEQPSPLVVFPSSHSSGLSTTPSPHVAVAPGAQSAGAGAPRPITRPLRSGRKDVNFAHQTSSPTVN